MTTIYLIRHAEAEGNLYRIAHGHYNSCITDERGCRQIRALAQRFRDVPVDAVYASDLIRTCTTAQSITVPKGLPLQKEPAFREQCLGCWEGQSWAALRQADPRLYDDFTHRPDRWHTEEAETARQVLERFLPALRVLSCRHDGQTIAVFSHGAALRLVLGTLQGLTPEQIGQTPFGENASVSCIAGEGEALRLLYRDDNAHLVAAGVTKRRQPQSDTQSPCLCYGPMTAQERRQLNIPGGGRAAAIRIDGQLAGAYHLPDSREAGVCLLGQYGLLPPWRGRGLGVQPLGRIIHDCRAQGLMRLRICCPDEALRSFWSKYGFVPLPGGQLEKDLTPRVLDAHITV